LGGVLFDKAQTTLVLFPEGLGGSYTVPDGVVSIGSSAFQSCGNLTSVPFPAGLTNIGDHAFYTDASLTNITIPDGVIAIGTYAFSQCYGLTSILIPASVTSIAGWAFLSAGGLTTIDVDAANLFYSSVDGVLFDKDKATLLQFPCGRGGSYSVPGGVTSIGDSAFQFCNGLNSVTLPAGITNIGGAAFMGDYSLTNVNIPDGVTSIAGSTFQSCISLHSITIPASVTYIGDVAFQDCQGLATVYFLGDAPGLGSIVFGTVFGGFPAAYYLPNTSGWGSNFGGCQTVLWLPQVLTTDAGFGVQTNQFGFNINWARGQALVIEACTNLANPVWEPVQTNTFTDILLFQRFLVDEFFRPFLSPPRGVTGKAPTGQVA
jgi:hypothetical protein